jgi:AraC-like DNA-binding protein
MDGADRFLYFLPMPQQTKTGDIIRFINTSSSVLGRITLSGFIRSSRSLSRTRPMRILGSYALVYLVDGAGTYEDANGYRQDVKAGDALLLFPKLGHYYGPGPGQHWTEIYLVFDGPVFKLWEQVGLLNPRQPVCHAEPIDYWLARIEAILGSSRQAGTGLSLVEVCRLQQVLAELLTDGMMSDSPSADRRWASQMCALLASDMDQTLDLRELAAKHHTTYHSFRKRFTRLVGMPPVRYRSLRLMDRACELMQSGEFTSKQIADQLGFVDEAHFSRRFKQLTGVSPRQFRTRLPGRYA